MPQSGVVAQHDRRGPQLVAPAGEGRELDARLGEVARLVVPSALAGQDLIGAEHQAPRRLAGDPPGLELGQSERGIARRDAIRTQRLLDLVLVDAAGSWSTSTPAAVSIFALAALADARTRRSAPGCAERPAH